MMSLQGYACFLLSAFFSLGLAAAPVYESVGPDGETSFTDRPTRDATELALPPVQTYDAPAIPTSVFESSGPDEAPGGYNEFRILTPTPGATFRNNGGKVPLRLALNPGLRVGDEIRFFMDGARLVGGRETSITLDNVDRGEHAVYAEVVNDRGKRVARSHPITFYLHRTSIPSVGRAILFNRARTRVPPTLPSR